MSEERMTRFERLAATLAALGAVVFSLGILILSGPGWALFIFGTLLLAAALIFAIKANCMNFYRRQRELRQAP